MTFKLYFAAVLVVAGCQLIPFASAQSNDGPVDDKVISGSDVQNQLVEREGKINKLSIEEQLKLRAAQVKAAEDPEVKEAAEKRNKAIQEFRLAFRNAMVKADPKIEEVLNKIAVGNNPGF